ncbi:PLP-dependent aminotransferase family protein [Burkholderia diffusa]|uniref:aminotransferase-like domain-containing protein n=1 Tax=Burkholderia diffusa TaxID=488732 RepID=UPI00075A62E3|nr:PLP-dependent aminotransferase family protein [Burkholderia diffusa]KVC45621.1 aspartate aminotransferase [Burkholderia diffusa]
MNDIVLAMRARGIKSSAVRELLEFSKNPDVISLAGGIPASDLFDMDGIDEALDAILREEHRDLFQYGLTEGELGLRQQISEWAGTLGIPASPESMLITSGSQQGLDLVARVLFDQGDRVLVERPTYVAALQVFQFIGAQIDGIRGSTDGLDLDQVERELKRGGVKAIYLTPNFANPTGYTMPLTQRVRLVELAQRHGCAIIEDDPYGQLRFSGEAIPSLLSIASQQSGGNRTVCYLSTFSKVFSPGVRVGWIALPEALRPPMAVAKQAFDLHTSTLTQDIVARYLASGRLASRIEVLRTAYRTRRDALTKALRGAFGDDLSFNEPEGGMFLWCRFARQVPAEEVLEAAIREKVVFVPGKAFYASDPEYDTLRVSYSMLGEQSAEEAAHRLKRAWDAVARG